ncbi:hypothetical protein Noda2021_00510 [Candidatus Dependentiae bacterium Noda2021]|nr:hypothetical protein Noda2021_00510 [Candidatus Dependentiae bacterium Noda2021]
MNTKYYLEQFRDLKIDKDQLYSMVSPSAHLSRPVMFDRFNVLHALRYLQHYQLSPEEFIDWVNVLWFKDAWFSFPEDEADCLSSIMDEIQEIEEQKLDIDEELLKKYIFALEHNLDVNELL